MQRDLPWRVDYISLPLNLTRSRSNCLKILLHLWLHVLEILHSCTIIDELALKIIQFREIVSQEVLYFILQVLGTVSL